MIDLPKLDLQQLYDELFPLCRSITGIGYRQSLDILQHYLPLNIETYPSESQVCNWTVPPEWILHRAVLKDSTGTVILDTDLNPMCLLNYSAPFHGRVSIQELEQHLFSLPDMPNVKPYVTAYYKHKWGFCLDQLQRASLTDDFYEVDIDTEYKEDGAVLIGTCELLGKSDRIIMLSSYLCHPCMMNNELSGPLALVCLYYLLASMPEREYTYRFVLNPETIGSICYLSKHAQELNEKLELGMVLTCLASPYKTGYGKSPILAIEPQAILTKVQNKSQQQAHDEQKNKHNPQLNHEQQLQFFNNLLHEISSAYSDNFLPNNLGFKLTRQSMMDEIQVQLHPSLDNAPTNTDNLKQRYVPDYIASLDLNNETAIACKQIDKSLVQHQTMRLQRSVNHILGTPDKLSKINIKPDNYTFAIDRFLTTWQSFRQTEVNLYPFTPLKGSDERQYCSALSNLPVVSIFRTKYDIDNYPFYHTQSDDQNYFSLDSVMDSAVKIFDVLEGYAYRNNSLKAQYVGEPQLGKYQLYPEINDYSANLERVKPSRAQTSPSLLNNILCILNLADGTLSLLELSQILNISLYELMHTIRVLTTNHLVELCSLDRKATLAS